MHLCPVFTRRREHKHIYWERHFGIRGTKEMGLQVPQGLLLFLRNVVPCPLIGGQEKGEALDDLV